MDDSQDSDQGANWHNFRFLKNMYHAHWNHSLLFELTGIVGHNMEESSLDGVKTSGEKSRQVRLHNFRILKIMLRFSYLHD